MEKLPREVIEQPQPLTVTTAILNNIEEIDFYKDVLKIWDQQIPESRYEGLT